MFSLYLLFSQAVRKFLGHTDCVRGLCLIDENSFASCGNDASVRLWSLKDGQCLRTLYGHTNFIYRCVSLVVFNDNFIYSCVYYSQHANQFDLCQPGLNVPLTIKRLNHVCRNSCHRLTLCVFHFASIACE